MAAVVEMGEVDEIHSKEDSIKDGIVLNGDISSIKSNTEENNDGELSDEVMEIDDGDQDSDQNDVESNSIEIDDEDSDDSDNVESVTSKDNDIEIHTIDNTDDDEDDDSSDVDDDDEDADDKANDDDDVEVHALSVEEVEVVKEICEPETETKSTKNDNTIVLNDSGDADIVIIDSNLPKENGNSHSPLADKKELKTIDLDDDDVINLDATPIKKIKKKPLLNESPRRSARNLSRSNRKSYIEAEDDEEEVKKESEEESDIEEVLPQDPLAVSEPSLNNDKITIKKQITQSGSSTIVVKDTKRLVEIASKSSPNNSGRGPIPISQKPSMSQQFPVLPVALPAQGLYPANMRATITPIPMTPKPSSINLSQVTQSVQPPLQPAIQQPPILPSLTDDMFVVEAPSFIVPYVYEKPPVKDLKQFVDNYAKEIKEQREKEEKLLEEEEMKKEEAKQEETRKQLEAEKELEDKKQEENKKLEDKKLEDEKLEMEDEKLDADEKKEPVTPTETEKPELKDLETEIEKIQIDKHGNSEKIPNEKVENESLEKKTDVDKKTEKVKSTQVEDTVKKPYSYFTSPLGKFFMDIGHNLVQEFVQNDLLKQQKRKREREGGKNIETNKTISSLIKNLEYTKENNEPYHMPVKKCEFCSFKTESALAMAFHLETPHMKNFVYKCNFCTYEVRSPHDILFHMEAEHTVRGRLDRAPAFHQCPNCPFEDNQKGKLSRHLVACTRKFKPDRNMEPPIDWEPPAKIPRVPRMKQNLSTTAAMYQAMAKNSQYQLMQKIQTNQSALNRGRGRPSLGTVKQPAIMRTPTGMIYKQAMSGGSVLLPTNYQLSGNQLYQVVGGQDMGGRIGTGGPMTLLPNISSATSTLTIQQQSPQNKPKPVHQPSISITPLPRNTSSSTQSAKPGDLNSKSSFVICEICDGYIKDLDQLRNHMQWIHKVKIHPKMIYNRPPLNCQKCQFRFFTDQGLERHLLGSHGLVTSSMQEAANKSKDSGRCPVCGRVYQWKLLNHVARDHNMTLKPAHLSYKCTVCTATFGMYKQFENHVYSAHSVVAKRVMDKKNSSSPSTAKNDSLLKPLKINDEITIIPQLSKSSSLAGGSKDGSNATSTTKSSISVTTTPSTSKSNENTAVSRAERLARRKTSSVADN